jgi:dihydroneopterin aldolase
MDSIRINNIRCYSFHGCIEEEAQSGGYFLVDIEVNGNWRKAAASDHLEDAVDYVKLSDIAIHEMKQRANLIETVAYKIADQIQSAYPTAEGTRVSITKERAPIEQDVASVTVTVSV